MPATQWFSSSKTPLANKYFYHIFYYAWWGNVATDGAYKHWNNNGHNPANNDIDSDYYPVLGAYSSKDPIAVNTHMQQIASAGIGTIVIAWWGQQSLGGDSAFIDQTVPGILTAANNNGLKVCFLIDQYAGRTIGSIDSDIKYIYNTYGSHPAFLRLSLPNKWGSSTANRGVFYMYNSLFFSDASWKSEIDSLRGTAYDGIFLGNTTDISRVDPAHWDGLFAYDVYLNDGSAWPAIGTALHNNNVLWSAAVGPGFNDIRDGEGLARSRQSGAIYDDMWQYAMTSSPTFISITSFNEWHEGSQIEPAQEFYGGGYVYLNFTGAYNTLGAASQTSYLSRTAYWTQTKFDLGNQGTLWGQEDTVSHTGKLLFDDGSSFLLLNDGSSMLLLQ